MPLPDETKRKLKPFLFAGLAIGLVVAAFYGNEISAFEDRILTALFGPRP